MANSLEQIHTQAKINTAIGVVQIAQTAAMNAKLRRLNKAQEESNAIQKQIAQINLYIAEEQRQQTELSTKSLSEQVRQTELQETQVKLSKFKIELDIHEKKEEKAEQRREKAEQIRKEKRIASQIKEIKDLKDHNDEISKKLLKLESKREKLIKKKDNINTKVVSLEGTIQKESKTFEELKNKYPFLSKAKIIENR